MTKYKIHRSRVENDLLQAIIIMNNAFKSGRSITQAIELVTKELEGPIAEEFKKMHLEISFGLEIDVVFKRLSERIELEEVSYLTASLAILNKTGGIVQGMSGSPILQNDKLVGAVTHVFVGDPTKGFGIYIDWMIDN